MATKTITWSDGSTATLTYNGQGSGTITVQSDPNNHYDSRSAQITIKTTNGSPVVTKTVTISQAAKSYPQGVWIQATDGSFISASDWTTQGAGKTANGIAIVTNDTKFIMALTEGSNLKMNRNSNNDPSPYITAITNLSDAYLDYDSVGNTQKWKTMGDNTSSQGAAYVAFFCLGYTFPDGVTKGSCPSCGAMKLILDNITEVNACLTACGGTQISNNYYFSSTYSGYASSNHRCWGKKNSDNTIIQMNIGNSFYTRIVAPLV